MFAIRFWLLLLLFVGSYRQQNAAGASPPITRTTTVPDTLESTMVDEGRSPLYGGYTSPLGQYLNNQQEGDFNLNEWQISNKDLFGNLTINDGVKFDFLEDHSQTTDREGFQEDILLPKNLTLRKIGGKKSDEYYKRDREEQEQRNSALSWQFGPNVEIFNNGNNGEENYSDGNTMLQNENGKSRFYGYSIWENGLDELNKTYPAGSYNLPYKDDETTTEKPPSSVIITGVTSKMNRDNVTSVQITSKKHKKKFPFHSILYCEQGKVDKKKVCPFPVKKTYPPLPDYKFPPHSNSTKLLLGYKSNGAPRISGLVEGHPFSRVTMSGDDLSEEWDDALERRNLTSVGITGPYLGRVTHHPGSPVAITEIPFIRLAQNHSNHNGVFVNETSTISIVEKRPFIDNAFFENGMPSFEREGKTHMEEKSDNKSNVVSKTKEGQREEESKLKEEMNMSIKEGFQGSKQVNQITNSEQVEFPPISENGKFTNSEAHEGKVEPQNIALNIRFNHQQETSSNAPNTNQFGNSQLVAGQDGNRLSGVEKMKLERNNTNMDFDPNFAGGNKAENQNFQGQALPDRKIMDNNSVFESQALNKNWIESKNSNNMMYQTGPGNTESKGSQLKENNPDFRNQTKNENLKASNEANNVMSQLVPVNSDGKVTDNFRGQIQDNWIGDNSANGMTQIRPTSTVTQVGKLGSSNTDSQARNGNWRPDENSNSAVYQIRPPNSLIHGEKVDNSYIGNQTRNGNWRPDENTNSAVYQIRPPNSLIHGEKGDNSYIGNQTRNGNWRPDEITNSAVYQIRPPNSLMHGEKVDNSYIGNQTRNGNWRPDENTNTAVYQIRPPNNLIHGEKIDNSYIGNQTRNGNWRADQNTNTAVYQIRPPNNLIHGEKIDNSYIGNQTRNSNWKPNENANNMVHQVRPNSMAQDGKMSNFDFRSQARNGNWKTDENANGTIPQVRPPNSMLGNPDFNSQTRNENWKTDQNANNIIQQTRPPNAIPQGERISANSDYGSQARNGNWRIDVNANNIIHQIQPSNPAPNSDFGSQTRNGDWRANGNTVSMMQRTWPPNTMSQGEQMNTNANGSQTRSENWRVETNNMMYQITPNTMPQEVKTTERNFDRSKTKNENWMPNEGVNGMMQQTNPFNTATQDGKYTNGNFDPRSQNKNGNWMADKNVNDIMHQDGRTSDKISDFRNQVKNEKWMPNKSAKDMMYEPISFNNMSQYNKATDRTPNLIIQPKNENRLSNDDGNNKVYQTRPPSPEEGKMMGVNIIFRGQSRNENWISNKNGTDTMHQTRPVNTATQDDNMKDRYSEFRIQDKNGKWMPNENSNDMKQRMRPSNTGPQDGKMPDRNSGQARNENRIPNKNTYSITWFSNENFNDMMHRIIPPKNQDSKMTVINSNPRSQSKDGNWRPDKNTNDRIQPTRLPNTMSRDDKMTGGNSDARSQTNTEHRMTAENSQAMIHQNIFQGGKGTENYNFRSQTRNENSMANGNANNISHQVRPSDNSGVADNHSVIKGGMASNALATNNTNRSPSFGNTHSKYEERKFFNGSLADNQYNFNQVSAANTSPTTNFPPENRMKSYTESKDALRPNNEPLHGKPVSPSALGITASFFTGFNIHQSSPIETSTQKSWGSPEDLGRELRNRLATISAGNRSNMQEAIVSDSDPSVGRLDMNIAFSGKFPSNQRRVTSDGYLHKNMGRLEVMPQMGADNVLFFPVSVMDLKNNITGRKMFLDNPSNMKQNLAGRQFIHVSAPIMKPSLVGKNMKQGFPERKMFPNNAPIINNLIPMFKNSKLQHHNSDENNDTKLRILVSNPQELVQILKEFNMKNARLKEKMMMASGKRVRGQNYPLDNRHTIKPGEDLLNLIQSFRRASELRRLQSFKDTGEKEDMFEYRQNVQDSQSVA